MKPPLEGHVELPVFVIVTGTVVFCPCASVTVGGAWYCAL